MATASDNTSSYPRIVVAGAGVIGCFVGGMLVRGAHNVTFFLRERLFDELSRQGLTVTDMGDLDEELSPDLFGMSMDPQCLAHADIILVTVKSSGTRTMADLIAKHAAPEAVVVSLQNGLDAVAVLRDSLPDMDVRAGVVPFAATYMGGGHFHRSSLGDILIQRGKGGIGRSLSVLDMPVHERRNIEAFQWGKLLQNLNNALNALSGLPLRQQLFDITWRKLLADQIAEALPVLKAEGIRAKLPNAERIPPRFLPMILRLPTPLFRRVANAMLRIDPHARSSMWDDLDRGRQTEIDDLQGQIVDLAARHDLPVRLNARVARLVRAAQTAERGSPKLMPHEVRGDIGVRS